MHCRRRAAISSAGQLPVPAALDTHFPTLPDVDGDSIHPLPGICNGVRRENCGGVEPRPYGQLGGWYGGTAGRCGERTKRCQWQRKRGERVAAVKISSVRRKAAQKFWAPQQDHRPLRRGTRSAGKESPRHGFAVPAPFRQGGRGDGVRIATGAVRPRNDIVFARGTVRNRRADRGVRPYGCIIGGA